MESQWTLSVLTYHVLAKPGVLKRLTDELEGVDLESVSWVELEKLPYLNAVIAESLRLSYGISSRTPRIAPLEHLVYRGHVAGKGDVEYMLPKGTAVGSEIFSPSCFAFNIVAKESSHVQVDVF